MTESTKKPARTNRQSIILFALIIIGVGTLILLQFKNASVGLSTRPRLTKGSPAPDFALSGLNGETIRLADYRGKIVLLNIWATWCPPCVEEMPSMEKLYQTFKKDAFDILAVSIDTAGAKVVRPFMEKHRLNFTALIDTQGTIKDLYQTTGVPESFVIDKNGIIISKVIGPTDWANPDTIKYFKTIIPES